MVKTILSALGRHPTPWLLMVVLGGGPLPLRAQATPAAPPQASPAGTQSQTATRANDAASTAGASKLAPALAHAPLPASTPAGAGRLIPVAPGAAPAAAPAVGEEVTTVSALSVPALETTTTTVAKAPVPALPVNRSAAAPTTPTLTANAQAPTSETATAGATPGTAEASTSTSAVSTALGVPMPESITEGIKPSGATAGQPSYLIERDALEIFDKGRSEELTPLQRAAQILSERRERQQRRSLANIQNLVTYEYTLTGSNSAQLREEAMVRALKSAAGRLYFEDYILLGRDLLEPYLRQYGKPFVTRTTVLERHPVTGKRVEEHLRVSVNLDSLYKDLQAKHFIAEPNLRPTVGVFLQEVVSGQPDPTVGGRARIERVMENNLFQPLSKLIKTPALEEDLSTSAGLLKRARDQAQRNDVDVLITGTLSIRPVSQEQIFYDPYSFQEADLNLKMYRVDTGEVLGEAVDRYSATSETAAQSIGKVLDVMIDRTAQKLADQLGARWANMMLTQGHYRLMISGVKRDEVTNLSNMIKSLAPDVQVYEKSYYGDVLVVHVIAPHETTDQMESFLRQASEPQLNVRRIDKRRFIVDIL